MIEDPLVRDEVSSIDRPELASSMLALLSTLRDSAGPNPPRRNMLVNRSESSFRSLFALLMTRLSDNALEAVLVPLDGLLLVDLVRGTDLALAAPALGDALTGAGHADVEVHAVDTGPC